MSLRVVVTGGREYADRQELWAALDELQLLHGIRLLAEGGCRYVVRGEEVSADRFACQWAESREIPCLTVWAPWKRKGKSAGPFRNGLMLDMVRPDVVVATAGGRGTQDCVDKALARGIDVRKISNEGK